MKEFCLKCVLCGKEFPNDAELHYTCDVCGVDGTLDVVYDFASVKKTFTKTSLAENRDTTLWRFADILPLDDLSSSKIPTLSVGGTPLYQDPILAKKYGVSEVFIKDDGRNPTGSLKDRASALCVVKALEHEDEPIIACASTGNAASSLAGFSAVSKVKCYIFVPESAPAAKVAQLAVYGANVVLVKGSYADAFDLASEAIERFGWYNRNCAINPYLVEGKKTCALEIAEQLNWEVPDRVFISVGDGCCISGLYKGFSDLMALGFTDKMPKLMGVQASGAKPIFDAYRDGSERVTFGDAQTVADSISVGAPRNWAKALRAVRKSGGEMLFVNDEDILSAIPELARSSGVFAEPAGAAAFAGFRQTALEEKLRSSERIAVVATGNGLKDIDGAQKAIKKAPPSCLPDIEVFVKLMKNFDKN